MSRYPDYPRDEYTRPAPAQPILLWILILVLLVSAAFSWGHWLFQPRAHGPVTDPTAQPRPITARGELGADEKATISLFQQALPSVVGIQTVAVQRDAWTFNLMKIPKGTGSGFVWDEQGRIVTNYHVIDGASEAYVTFSDQNSYKAQLIGGDRSKDLAVLQVQAPEAKLRPLLVGESGKLQVGQKVFAIGNPFGLSETLTSGIVSGLGREVNTDEGGALTNLIQTDAAINPGNSGGPLLDSAGLLVGVNTAILSPSGAYAGIGFAIPVDEVQRVVPQLIKYGKVVRPSLGIVAAPEQATLRLNIDGILVLNVYPDGPAEKAGLQPTTRNRRGQIALGDVIVALDGVPVPNFEKLQDEVMKHEVGATVKVRVLRQGNDGTRTPVEVDVKLAAAVD